MLHPHQSLKIFSLSGRMSRLPYIALSLGALAISLCALMLMSLSGFDFENTQSVGSWFLTYGVIYVVVGPMTVIWDIRRLHDLNYPGWWVPPLFLISTTLEMLYACYPNATYLAWLCNILGGSCAMLTLFLTFKKGTIGNNHYGAPSFYDKKFYKKLLIGMILLLFPFLFLFSLSFLVL